MARSPYLRWCLALVAPVLVSGAAAAQQCYTRSPFLSDICSSPPATYYSSAARSVVTLELGGEAYALIGQYNNAKLYRISNPASPVGVGQSVSPPWTYDEGTHTYLKVHIYTPAVTDDFNYAFVPLSSWGWDWLKLTPTPTFLGIGYDPGAAVGDQYAAVMFRHSNGKVYLVGNYVDQTANDFRDKSIYVYEIGNASTGLTPESISYATLASYRKGRIPLGGVDDPSPYSSYRVSSDSRVEAWYYYAGGKDYLLFKSGLNGAIIDVSGIGNPLTPPTGVAYLGSGGTFEHSSLFTGGWTVDEEGARLAVGGGGSVHFYNIANPSSISYDGSVAWTTGTTSSAATIDADGSLLSLAYSDWEGYIAIGDGNPFALGEQEPFTYNSRDCGQGETVAGDQLNQISVLDYNGTHLVARAGNAFSDVITVSSACLSTTPRPKLAVTRDTDTGTPSCAGNGIKGFPGDTFTITDTSGGTYTSSEVFVRTVQGQGGDGQGAKAPGSQWTWNPTEPGQYYIDIKLYGADTGYDSATEVPPTTVPVVICGDPEAGGAVTKVDGTACSGACDTWLQGQTLTLSAVPPRSQGNPSGTPNTYSWFIVPPSGSPADEQDTAEASLQLVEQGQYNVLVIAKYAHTATDDLGDCEFLDFGGISTWLGTQAGLNNTYDSCAYVGAIDSQPFSTSTEVRMLQGGVEPQIYLRSDPIVAEFDYRVSGAPWSATFDWKLVTASGQVDLGTTGPYSDCVAGCTTTWTFPGGSLTEGTYTVKVQGTATDGSDALVIAPPTPAEKTIAVQDCTTPSTPTLVSPSNNASNQNTSLTLEWSDAGGNPAATYKVYLGQDGAIFPKQVVCGGGVTPLTATSCSVSGLYEGTTYEWWVVASNLCAPDGIESSHRKFTTKTTTPPPPPPPTCTTPVVTGVALNPAAPSTGSPTSFTATVAGTFTSVAWRILVPGPSGDIAISSFAGNPASYTFESPGDYKVEAKAINDTCVSNPFTRNVTVATNCTETTPPIPSIGWTPSVTKVGETVSFTGSATNNPTGWSWNFGDPNVLPSQNSSTQQAPVHVYSQVGTYTVTLTATNCFGTSAPVTAQISIVPDCAESAAPDASIDWQEKGTFEFDGQVFNQPYVGQTVHLLGGGTNNPDSFNWYDFGDGGAATTEQDPTHVWTTPGLKNLRMKATNCFGTSEEAYTQIQVYSDSRPVLPSFDISGGGAQAMAPGDPGEPSDAFSTNTILTFTAATGYNAGDPVVFKWDFGDGTAEVEGNPVNHVYECRGTYKVTLRAGRYQIPGDSGSPVVWGTANASLDIDGEFCGPESVIATGAAKVPGFNGTSWRTDMHIFNPSETNTEVHLGILPAGQANSNPFEFGPYTLAPKATLVLRDILGVFNDLPGVTQDYTKAAIRIMYDNDEDMPPVVMQRTYTDVVGGGTYGQFIPGVQVVREPPPSVVWLTGLRNNGLETGFRTNVGLTHLKGDVGDAKGITLTLVDASGAVKGTRNLDLAPYGFVQESLVNLFGASVETIGAASLRVEAPEGAQVLTYYSEVDNLTGDPFLVTSGPEPSGKIIVPGVARLAGEAGTLWRTDVQLTNTDAESHVWELKFFPRGDVPVVSKALPIEPGQSILVEDIVQWVYQPFDTPDASGVLCVLPLEANGAMPTTSARTYNLTPSGTYGQFIVPLDASRGAAAGTDYSHLYITGMSTEDVARTNLGFVNLGDATVNFDVYFYDRDGDLLNPGGAPYTFALGVNGWDQDKLENRFRNFFGEELPANQEAISVVVLVKSGGPGFAYASVIDPITGDPMLIPGQVAP